MARIRSIKPEFWTSAQIMDCRVAARLLFIGLWNFADDQGRMVYSPRRVKAQIFASDDFSADDIHGMIRELERNNLVRLYDLENTQYLQVTGWHHQKISHPQKSILPQPPPEDSVNSHGALREPSRSAQGSFRPDLILSDLSSSKASAQSLEPARASKPDEAAARDFDRLERTCREAAGLENDPSTGLLNLSPIIGWLDAGHDLETDIVPTLRAVAKRGGKGRAWSYYTQAVTDAKTQRSKAMNGAAITGPAPAKPLSKTEQEAIWTTMMDWWDKKHDWPFDGPNPECAGCRVPQEFRDKRGAVSASTNLVNRA
jgi:hypothetical protein